MHRSAALLALAALAACQDYQFSQVGRCLLQPGRASVSSVAAVDVLFVVDDSLSMDAVQARLATNFSAFIDRLAQKQRDRVAAGKEPFEFYIAITSSSVLVNRYLPSNGDCGRVSPNTCSIEAVTRPPDDRTPYSYRCDSGACGDIVTHYYNFTSAPTDPRPTCARGVLGKNGDPYPAGAFVAAGSNPKVLAFTRDLAWANASGDRKIQDLMAKFRENVQVGSCGANQEMHLEAARLAIQNALAGKQGLAAGTWPHPSSKLQVIFVGNEDDCSTKRADEGGLVWDGKQAGQDNCHAEAQLQNPLKLTRTDEYVSFLTGLGRPVGVAFVRPGFSDCAGAGGPGTRMHGVATAMTAAGASVIEASVCGAFSDALARIADDLAPPDRLALPTTPAAGDVTRLRIDDQAGNPVHVCVGPDRAREWWFVDCATNPPVALPPGQTSGCVQVQAGGLCEPQPGQTLQAVYLGRVPEDGCAAPRDCATALGGELNQWACEGASGAQRGTCVCAQQ
jgi:hypothetical protein